MNGVHDMGGMDGLGRFDPAHDPRVFHAGWEGKVWALSRAMAMTGAWNIDTNRALMEELPAHVYLESSYYRRWLLRLEKALVELGFVGGDEIKAGRALHPPKPTPRGRATLERLDSGTNRGRYGRPPAAAARFAVGDRVRARNINPRGHTRLPRYARGQVGIIERCQGCHVFPDSNALGRGENPQWLYTVRFDGRDLWGPDSDPTLTVSIEAFESYLEPV